MSEEAQRSGSAATPGNGPASSLSIGMESLGNFKANAFLYLRRRVLNAALLLFGDLCAILLGLLAGATVRMLLLGQFLMPPWVWLLFIGWCVGAYVAKILPGWGEGAPEELRRSVVVLTAVYGAFVLALFLGKQADVTSRFVFIVGFATTLVLIPLNRVLVKRFLLSRKLWGVPAVIFANASHAERVVRALNASPGFGYFPAAVIDTRQNPEFGDIDGVPVRPPARTIASSAPVAIVIMPGMEHAEVVSMLDGVLTAYSRVLIVPDLIDFPSLWVRTLDLNEGMLVLQVTNNQLSATTALFKRLFDLVSVSLTAIAWVPLLGALGFAIWISDRSSPFFRQQRVGRAGRPFAAVKFRTMVPDAEQALESALADDPALRKEWAKNFKLREDPRITRLGRILRRTSADELPQLINVLRGEMSLVGPRPLPDYHHRRLRKQVRSLREGVRPGMTGLWQISGRSTIGDEGMERWDSYYVRNWSIWLDVVIFWRTLRAIVRGEGAY